jgi:hypothetical protein
MKIRLADPRRFFVSIGSTDQDGLASGLVSGDVAGDVSTDGSGASEGDVLVLEFEHAPTANAAARISRASRDLKVNPPVWVATPP